MSAFRRQSSRTSPQGTVTSGFRIYDDYGSYYDNNWESIPDDDLEVLERVVENHKSGIGVARVVDDPIKEMLEFVKKEHEGIEINGEWYDWEKISDILEGL